MEITKLQSFFTIEVIETQSTSKTVKQRARNRNQTFL